MQHLSKSISSLLEQEAFCKYFHDELLAKGEQQWQTRNKGTQGNGRAAPSHPGLPQRPGAGHRKCKEKHRQQTLPSAPTPTKVLLHAKPLLQEGLGKGRRGVDMAFPLLLSCGGCNMGCWALTYRPRPATQCTATQQPGSSQNLVFNKLSQSSTILVGGGAPSSNGQSCRERGRVREERNALKAVD